MPLDGSSISSSGLAPSIEGLISLGLYAGMALALIVFLLLACRLLGRKTVSPLKGAAYESGVAGSGPAYPRQPAPFYLVAIFFIIFDIEVVFVASWAVAYDLLGWNGFFQILFFIVVLFLGLVYLWSRGGLDWGPRRRHDEVKQQP
ncbi:MAG: NADH-quinone oxidoreductase subunit A [Syntrophotaleaceae bacterium]